MDRQIKASSRWWPDPLYCTCSTSLMLQYFLKKKNREMRKKGTRGRCYGSRAPTWAAAWRAVRCFRYSSNFVDEDGKDTLQSAQANRRSWPMEFKQHRSNKARGAQLKPEEGSVMQDGGSPRWRWKTWRSSRIQIDVTIDIDVLLCQACLLPLKPPIFKCEAAGHILRSYCRGGHADTCSRADTHCGELDAVASAVKILCPYGEFGCERYVVFHGAAEHKRTCPCAPCSCPEPGCAFQGSPLT